MAGIIESTNQFQTLLIALVLIVAVVYFFIELRRIESRINGLEVGMRKIVNSTQVRNTPPEKPKVTEGFVDSKNESKPLEQTKDQPSERIVDITTKEYDVTNDIVQEPVDTSITQEVVENIVEEPTVEEPSVEEPSVEEPSVEEPSVEEPSVEEPSVEEPTIEDVTEDFSESVDDIVDNVLEQEDEDETGINIQISDNSSINDPILDISTINYESYTIKELKDILSDMNLSTSGNKSKLIQRIISNKK